nr:glycine--tRNA ligase subunit beta [Cyanobacteriota bacterium]
GLAPDLVQAVAGEALPLQRLLRDPADAQQRAELLGALRHSGQLAAVQAVVTRAARLAAKGDLAADVLGVAGIIDANLFEQASEAQMLEVLSQLEPIASASDDDRYARLAQALAAAAPILEAFFDGEESVMVMVEDDAIRRNRLNMLALLRNQASVLADFSRIQG